MSYVRFLIVFLIIALSAPTSFAEDLTPTRAGKLGLKIAVAFKCSAYAELAEVKTEQARLFQLGYSSGQEFLRSLPGGTKERAAISKKLPVTLKVTMIGPSHEFMLGRAFEHFARAAYDKVHEGCDRCDKEVIKLRAQLQFVDDNCSLIE